MLPYFNVDKKVAVVAVVEQSTGKLLAIRRAPEEENHFPEHDWSFVTETYEDDLDPSLSHCASRGLDEEVNIQTSPSEFYDAGRRAKEEAYCGYFIFPIRDRSEQVIRYQPEEVIDHQWVEPEEFIQLLRGSPFMKESFDFILTIESIFL